MKRLVLFSFAAFMGITSANAYNINIACPVLNPTMFKEGDPLPPKNNEVGIYKYNVANLFSPNDLVITINANNDAYLRLSYFHLRSTLVGRFYIYNVLHNIEALKQKKDVKLKGITFVKAEDQPGGHYHCFYNFTYENLTTKSGEPHLSVSMNFLPAQEFTACKADNNGKGFDCEIKK